jgi:hypothetical protein
VKKTHVIGSALAVVALTLAATGIAVAKSGDSTVSAPQARQATSAALEITGGGHANSVERDTENGATWEVEVTKPDGDTVDVRLDERFALVVVESDHEGGTGS